MILLDNGIDHYGGEDDLQAKPFTNVRKHLIYREHAKARKIIEHQKKL